MKDIVKMLFGGNFQSGVYERGGRFQTTKTITEMIKDGYYVSDAFDTYKQAENVCDIKDLQSGKVVIVRDKNYFTIAEKRKKYDDGGSLNSKVNPKWRNLALENFYSKNYKNLKLELGAEPSYEYGKSNKKHQNKIKIKPFLVEVNSLEEATKKFQDFNKENDLNEYNIIGGDIYAGKEIVGRIDTDGRFHDYKYGSARLVGDKLVYPAKYDYPENENFENGGDFQSGVYADGGYFDGSIPKVNTYMTTYAKGGSLEAHGIEVGDTFVKTISGGIQKVKNKNGKIVYINLSNGERDSQPPLPFANGGGVGIEEDIDMTDDKKLRVRKPAMPEKKLTQQEWAEKHNAGAYEYMGKEKMATGGGVNNGYNVFNYTDNIYATDEVFKTKALANKFIKEFRNRFVNQGYYRDNRMNKINIEDIDLLAIPSDFNPYKKYATGGALVGNQSRIDMNKNGKIDAEDFKLLRSSMNGAWRNERKHVNHSEDYEVRYAKPRPSRTGYKGKRKFEDGGGVSNSERFSKVVAKNYNKK